MRTSDFDYDLPLERIAQTPIEPRDASRLMVLERSTGAIHHSHFSEIGSFLRPGDILVMNETRVIPARIYGRKLQTGGRIELLLLRKQEETTWEALGGGKGLRKGIALELDGGLKAEIVQVLDGARRLVRFAQPVEPYLDRFGHTPLPPYIHTNLENPERYQTVYARLPGSAAAPTAGLHFTSQLLQSLNNDGFLFTTVTLHVGLDTFAPVTEENPQKHKIHTEWCDLSPGAAEKINLARNQGGHIVAVGTTSVRTLESAARQAKSGNVVAPFTGDTELFILPGYRFKAVDIIVTNFHLPRSTLLMLVSAFAGRQRILDAYQLAVAEKYRFFSFGDAMLIL
jgi:S-adenosylmethionine:tRNA ribosyltransferase-isomerase